MQPQDEPGGPPAPPPGAPLLPHSTGPGQPMPGGPTGAPAPSGAAGEPVAKPERERITRTISSALWIGLIIGAVLLILLIVFIVENSRTVKIDLIFGDTRTALAIGLLLSAVIGALLVAIPGTIRILQLRRQLKRHLR